MPPRGAMTDVPVVPENGGSYHPPMPVLTYHDILRRFGERVFLAPTAWVSGDVVTGDDVSFWFHTVARGDVHRIRIGHRTNIQDGAVLHVTHAMHPLEIGDDVVVGHAAVLHGCTVEDRVLVGIGARERAGIGEVAARYVEVKERYRALAGDGTRGEA